MVTETKKIDVTGLTCPMPLISIRSVIDALQTGERIEICGDDPVFESTMRDFCDENKHTILSVDVQGRVVTMLIEK